MKLNVLKKLLFAGPVITVPLMACSINAPLKNSSNLANPRNKPSVSPYDPTGYVAAMATALNAQFDSTPFKSLISSSSNPSHFENHTNKVNITSYINNAFTVARATLKNEGLNPNFLLSVNITFSLSSNMSITKTTDREYFLTVYPANIAGTGIATITTNISLIIIKLSANQKITNNYNLIKGFVNYAEQLVGVSINEMQFSSDKKTMYLATDTGLKIGTFNGHSYKFKTFTTANGLGSNITNGVYAPSSGGAIYVATNDGVSIGIKDGSSYTFSNTTTGLGSRVVYKVHASQYGSTIFAATAGGLSIALKGSNTFGNYTTTDGLGSNSVNNFTFSADGSIVYAATSGGISFGKWQTASITHFKNEVTGQGNNDFLSVSLAPDGNTFYCGTDNGVTVGRRFGSDYFALVNNVAGLPSKSQVNDVHMGSDNRLYAATSGGVVIGTKKAAGIYTFQISTTNGLNSLNDKSIYLSSDLKTIWVTTTQGLSISKSIWSSPSKNLLNLKITNDSFE